MKCERMCVCVLCSFFHLIFFSSLHSVVFIEHHHRKKNYKRIHNTYKKTIHGFTCSSYRIYPKQQQQQQQQQWLRSDSWLYLMSMCVYIIYKCFGKLNMACVLYSFQRQQKKKKKKNK